MRQNPQTAAARGIDQRFLKHAACLLALAATLLAACASGPPAPGWAVAAHSAAQRASSATLQGHPRVETLEWRKARAEITRTARPDLLARLELLRCAAQSAALLWEDCPAYRPLARDASVAEAAYARYLAAAPAPDDIAHLPAAQRPLAAILLAASRTPAPAQQPSAALAAVQNMAEPLPRLVAASVALRAGLGSAALLQLGIDTASAQGWSRALMAWLLLQQRTCEEQGDSACFHAARRRLDLLRAP